MSSVHRDNSLALKYICKVCVTGTRILVWYNMRKLTGRKNIQLNTTSTNSAYILWVYESLSTMLTHICPRDPIVMTAWHGNAFCIIDFLTICKGPAASGIWLKVRIAGILCFSMSVAWKTVVAGFWRQHDSLLSHYFVNRLPLSTTSVWKTINSSLQKRT